ncbi:MAG: redox-sensing transcriptional repressor Rex [Thermoleophilia bacterium]|nr:redox-sensing transcriptional repressor Rex [Thermoleophilia bacterium]
MATAGKPAVSRKTVNRLSLYRRLLDNLRQSGTTNIYSHELAHLAGVSATQVRRDLMVIGYSGSPNKGYEVETCLASIESLLEGTTRQDVALVGLGRLGRSLLAHFAGQRPLLRIAAGFDTDKSLIGTSIEGCPVYGVADMERVVFEQGIRIAILAVPPDVAQSVVEDLVRAGVRSFVDFTGIPLQVPEDVFVDHMDITSALESAAFFARQEHPASSALENGSENGSEPDMDPMIRTIDTLLAGADMKLDELAVKIGARMLTPGPRGGGEVTRIYAGDRVSDLLNEASDKTLLVTNLANLQMVRVAELMEVPGICFVDGVDPGQEIIDLATENGTLLMVSPVGVFETCGLIYQLLTSNSRN